MERLVSLRDLSDEDIEGFKPEELVCGKCDHRWSPRKALDEYKEISCPDCGKKSHKRIFVLKDFDKEVIDEEDFEEFDDSVDMMSPNEEVASELETFFKGICDKTKLDYKSIEFLAIDDVRELGDIPDPAQLFSLIMGSSAGLNNETAIEKIVSKYQRFVQGNITIQQHLQQGNVTIGRMSWNDGGYGSRGGGGGGGGGWVGAGFGNNRQGDQSQMQMIQMFQSMMEKQQRQFEKLIAEVSGSKSPNQDNGLTDTLESIKRQQEILNEITGSDDQINNLQAQLAEIREHIAQGQLSDAQAAQKVGSIEDRLLMMAMESNNVDLSEVLDIIRREESVSSDPEVLKMEKEKDIKEMELDHQERRMERLGQLGETMMQRLGTAIGNGMMESAEVDQADGDTDVAERAEPSSHQAASQSQSRCENCGGELISDQHSQMCPECEWGIHQCDNCTYPLEVPPIGETTLRGCPECTGVAELVDSGDYDADVEMECDSCGWTGQVDDAGMEFVWCDNCETARQVLRQDQVRELEAEAHDVSADMAEETFSMSDIESSGD